jgi:pimeloyl-ACP methyl ester carboxylesterase
LDIPELRTRLRVVEIGSGEPVVFVHGGGGMALDWAPLASRISGFRLLLLDRPGHGLSEPFDYRGVHLREHAVVCLESVLAALGLSSARFVANSMGALWALSLAVASPTRVRSLALLGCPALLLDTGAPALVHLMAAVGPWMLRLGKPTRDQGRRMARTIMGAHAAERLDPDVFECGFQVQSLPGIGESTMNMFGRALTLFGRRPEAVFGESDVRRVSQPTLFVWGDADRFGKPAVGQRACEHMPHARMEVIAGAGHLPWVDEPERCAGLVGNFLATS